MSRRTCAIALAAIGSMWPVEVEAANVFVFSPPWGFVVPWDQWSFDAGDFTGDGRLDVVAYHPSNGAVFVGVNTGSQFSWEQWANVPAPVGSWRLIAGDFTGDGFVDVAGYESTSGVLKMGVNTGAGFNFSSDWATGLAISWTFLAGDFTGDGRLDLFGYNASNGDLKVGVNTGTSFAFGAPWMNVDPDDGQWEFRAGDFTRDGVLDVAGYHPSNGFIQVGRSSGSSFVFSVWSALVPSTGWRLISAAGGDFAGDGGADVVAYKSDGTLWVGRSAGTRFFMSYEKWGEVDPDQGWTFVPGDFTGDGRLDLFGYHPSTGLVWVGRNTGLPPEGYAWPISAAPGQTIEFKVSGAADSTVDFVRHKSTGPTVSSFLMSRTTFTPATQVMPIEPWREGCGWATSFTLTIPPTWPSGYYSARIRSFNSADAHIPFIVKADPAKKSSVALLANINTWLAYNDWGGKGKYNSSALVSFLRPNVHASPIGEGFQNHHLTRAELWLFSWLEDQGYRPDVYTDLDFHHGISGYDKLVFGTHPEYWSKDEYDRLSGFLDSGGSVIYIGGNGVYENAEYTANDTAMLFLNGIEGGAREPAFFRMLESPPRPERALLGVATEACSVSESAFETDLPGHFLLANSGLALQQTFGASGLNTRGGTLVNGKASAWEVDTSAGPGATGMGCSVGSPLVPPGSNLPAGLEILAHGQGTPGAEMTYYPHPGGGFVLSVGSITAAGSLVVDPALQQILRNALNVP